MAKAEKLKHALQAGLGAYTYLRTEVSATPDADREVVTESILTAIAEIGLSPSELTELRIAVSHAPTGSIVEPAILANEAALKDLAKDLDADEQLDFAVKLQLLIDEANGR